MPRLALLFALAVCACHRSPRSISTSTLDSLATSLPASSAGAAAPALPSGTPCDALETPEAASGGPRGETCTQYDSARDAFLHAIASDPLVLAIGEAHAPSSLPAARADAGRASAVVSAAKRFTGELLPLLAGRASDLLLELMMPPSGCLDAAAEVRRLEEPVTSRHAETAQDDYVAMGERARALGIVPDMLRPTCEDMDAIRHAKDDFLDVSLTTIARLSRAQAMRLVDRDARSDVDRGKMVVLYGGALHNDLSPAAGAARWSYAPELDAHVQGRFVAVDLIVPEFIGEDDTWRSLPWWPLYESARQGAARRAGQKPSFGQKATVLFTSVDGGAVLVFPAALPP